MLGGDLGGQVEDAQQSAIVTVGAAQVAADSTGVSGHGCQAGNTSEAVGGAEGGHVAAGEADEFGAEQRADAGHAQ